MAHQHHQQHNKQDPALWLLDRIADALERTADAAEALVRQGAPRIPVSMVLRVGAPQQES
jgi:hypothetical protein